MSPVFPLFPLCGSHCPGKVSTKGPEGMPNLQHHGASSHSPRFGCQNAEWAPLRPVAQTGICSQFD